MRRDPWSYGEKDMFAGEYFFDSVKCSREGRNSLMFSALHSVCNTFWIDGNGPFRLFPGDKLSLQIADGEVISFEIF